MITLTRFLEKTPKPVFEIAAILKEHNFQAYLVGGSVRDVLLGKTPHDFDICTDALPDTLLDLFPRSIEVGAKFGTIIVLASRLGLTDRTEQEEEYQVTTFRSDGIYINGRWPEKVEFSKTIEEDLSRRDFTINAFAVDMIKVIDYIEQQLPTDIPFTNIINDLFSGKKDLEDGIIRAVGDPYIRMKEDGLRAFRACRFAAKLEFTIEIETFNAIKAAATTVDQLSTERIRDEFVKNLEAPTPSIGIELMRRANLLEKFIPELLEGVGMEQNAYHIHDLYNHLLASCDIAEDRVRLVALLHDIGKSRTKDGEHFYGHEEVGAIMAEEILTRLKFPKKDILYIPKLIRLHMFNYLPSWSDAAVRRFLNKVGDDETLKDLFLLRLADALSNPAGEYDPENLKELEKRIMKVKEEDNALNLKDLRINGYDLQHEGITDGKEIGRILHEILEKVLDEPSLNDHDKLIQIAKGLHKNE